ncbi:LuxR C-terminal-related transcriptional regulator (plasmid) [Alicyclobacillus fastidiosus]|uniref:LuxR C-terminal-related transcriptional regulator n=1 Tax=Alicyclobacillus fastidiosus TaxID=392011 RepID=A0ABY6ZP71_9BACL|nr:LuxR C-terminal-related transcriptional regulator [Alicyclobacillus fastidiosus]WAH44790.1 LuxR C-terminal-related transcriptional regulator [Alicyclobacillus fastidiosus]GMA65745.1 hypothetical protein GCM10025859_61850 [Alicyclobacillus fastidiosus]GMA65919.1 hypothetical protein GCM10025859_63600 [Alicyclobacillus fastidiosus]
MQDLIRDYQDQVETLRQKKNLCKDFATKKLYASMIESMTYAIRQMKNDEDNHPRTILLETEALNNMAVVYDSYSVLEDEENDTAATVTLDMSSLSFRESRVLRSLMDGMTFQEIADSMKITKSTVQKYADRARAKLSRMRTAGVQMALFNSLDDDGGVFASGLFRTAN